MTSTAEPGGAAPYQPGREPARDDVMVGETMRYRVWRWGDLGGRLVVLLHGWMDTGASFQFLVDRLPDDWTLIAPDWRGFGESDRAPENYYFPDYMADLDALLDHYAGAAPVVLIGHSMGGNVAGLYAGVRPERVARLVSLEGFGLSEASAEVAPKRYAEWLDSLREMPRLRRFDDFTALAGHLRQQNPRLSPERAAYIARCWGEAAPDGTVRLRGDPRHKRPNPVLYRVEEARACWRSIAAPTLWVMGSESGILQRLGVEAAFEERLRCIPDGRMQILQDAGHALHHDQPEALAEMLQAFVDPA